MLEYDIKKINFNAKKTEYEWQQTIDKFSLKFVPKWFDFLNWIVLLGIFNFLAEYTHDWKLKIIYLISVAGLLMFLQSYFFNIRFDGLPFIKSERAKRSISIIIGGIISTGVFILLSKIIPLISEKI